MEGILYLIGSVLFGMGLIRKIFPFADGPETLFWGMALGIQIPTWLAYLISRSLYEVNFSALIILTITIWVFALFLLRSYLREVLSNDLSESLRDNKYLILLLALIMPVFYFFFNAGMFRSEADGLYLTATSWYDMALHLAISNSFVYGQNFPPQYMVMPDEPMRYPFLPDFHAAIFLKFGWGLWSTFAVTSLWAAVALVGTFYCFARRLANTNSSAFIAALIFLFSGGFGFLLFLSDWYSGDKSFITHYFEMKENYTDMLSRGVKFVSLITSGLIPQRAMLYGMPITFFILSLIAIVWKNWWESDDKSRWDNSQILFAAGILTGLLPLFHVHSYMSVGLISGFLFLIRPRFEWVIFWLPAVLLALPQIISSGGNLTTSEFLQIQLGWMSHSGDNFLVFMLLNFGLPLIIIVPALFYVPRYVQTFYVAFAALMIFCFIFRISPNDFDNIKLIYYWYAGNAVVIAVWLGQLAASPKLRVLVVLIVLVCTASGILATIRETRLIYRIYSPDEIEAGIFSRDQTEPHALFLTGQYHNQPALGLAGKRIVLGYDFWILSHGYKREMYDMMKEEVRQIYLGNATTENMLESKKIDYVYIGENERKESKANERYFNDRHILVFKNASISIYKVKRAP